MDELHCVLGKKRDTVTRLNGDENGKSDMTENELYKTFCEPRFKAIEDKVDDIHKVICGNGKEGLADTVRQHDKLFGRVFWTIGVIFVAVIGATVRTFTR